jgi:hypothetical protein
MDAERGTLSLWLFGTTTVVGLGLGVLFWQSGVANADKICGGVGAAAGVVTLVLAVTRARPGTDLSYPTEEFVLLLRACVSQAKLAHFDTKTPIRERRVRLVRAQFDLLGVLLERSPELDERCGPGTEARARLLVTDILPAYCEAPEPDRKELVVRCDTAWNQLREWFDTDEELASLLADAELESREWETFGFAAKSDLAEYLVPTFKSLPDPPAEPHQLMIRKLLRGPVDADSYDGPAKNTAADLLGRLLAEGWATTKDDSTFTLTEPGREALRQRAEGWS